MAGNLTALFRFRPSAAIITPSLTKVVVGTIINSRFQAKLQAEKRYTSQRIAMFVQVLAKLREAGETLKARALKNHLSTLAKPDCAGFKSQAISNTIWGLGSLGMIDYQQQHVVATTGAMVCLTPWSMQEIANFIRRLTIAAAVPFTDIDVAQSTGHALEGALRATAWLDQLLIFAIPMMKLKTCMT